MGLVNPSSRLRRTYLVSIQVLLQHNAKVYMASRSQAKAEAAIKELKEQTGKEALFLKLDLGDLKTIKVGKRESGNGAS